MILKLQREIESIIKGIIELVYFMRGSITYEEMMRRTYGERQRMGEFLEKRLEHESKKTTPVY